MKQIKVYFCDFWDDYKKKSWFYRDTMNILKKKYIVIEDKYNPDFLFYSVFGNEHRKYRKPIKIEFIYENVRPRFSECDYAVSFDHIDNDRNFTHHIYINRNPLKEDSYYLNRKFCNFIYSNFRNGEGARKRIEFFIMLNQYKHVDAPGLVMNNMNDESLLSSKNDIDYLSKIEFIKNYKFTISFENFYYPGYCTEKIIHPFIADSIPIYLGDTIIEKKFNKNAFINCRNFKDFNEVVSYIKYLDNNNEAYLKMIKEHPMNPNYKKENEYKNFLLNIIERGKKYVI